MEVRRLWVTVRLEEKDIELAAASKRAAAQPGRGAFSSKATTWGSVAQLLLFFSFSWGPWALGSTSIRSRESKQEKVPASHAAAGLGQESPYNASRVTGS